MSAHPLVSVIIPAYNAAGTLEETLRSVLISDYPSLEVIVVDDGSSDGTLALAQKVAESDARVRCFTQVNGGGEQCPEPCAEGSSRSLYFSDGCR